MGRFLCFSECTKIATAVILTILELQNRITEIGGSVKKKLKLLFKNFDNTKIRVETLH